DSAADRALERQGAELAVAQGGVAGEFLRRLARIELDDARRRVAAEQRALRAAQDFDVVDVEHREAFQNDVLEDDFVDDDRYRLRGGQVEIGIPEAADV